MCKNIQKLIDQLIYEPTGEEKDRLFLVSNYPEIQKHRTKVSNRYIRRFKKHLCAKRIFKGGTLEYSIKQIRKVSYEDKPLMVRSA